MSPMRKSIAACCLMSFALISTSTQARPPEGGKPPQEAIDACKGKADGELVTFETRRGDTLTGTCELVKEQLVAIPENHKSRDRD